MLQVKSHYQKKIDELHGLIEEAAIELQRVREEIEAQKKIREEVKQNISKLRDNFTTLGNDRSLAKGELGKLQKAHAKEIKEHESRLEDRKNQVTRLEKKEKELEEKTITLNSVKDEVKKERSILNDIGESIDDLVSERTSLESEVSGLESKKMALNKEILEARGKANKIVESATITAKDAHKFYNSMGPWISAIAQWHAVHGGEMPELLHDWKPKAIVVSSQIHKLLKDKQK